MAGDPTSGIFIGSAAGGANPQQLELKRANRHGLIAGATGTGKTVTLQGIVEGLSAAGETIGSNSFVAEHAPRARRGLFVASVYTWSNLPPVLAALLVLALTQAMSGESYESWGWRVPFLLGAPLALIGLYIRTRVSETPAFRALKESRKVEKSPIRTALRESRRAKKEAAAE